MNEFWKATGIRAIKTICQTAVATIGTAVVLSDVDWRFVASASILAGILSVLTSIGMGLPEVDPDVELTEEELADFESEGDDDEMDE